MTYVPHYRATFKGDFRPSLEAEPYEQWNTSVALRGGGQYSTASAQAIANDLRDDFAAFVRSLEAFFSGSTVFTEVRLDHVGVSGRIDQDAVFAQVDGAGVAGVGGPRLPPSCAVVLTLDTQQRGRSRFGRMYLPLIGCDVSGDGGMPSASQDAILAASRTFITNLGNAPGIDDNFSVAVASGVGEGALNAVRAVRVGRVIDTMRSRRRSIDESYKSATIST